MKDHTETRWLSKEPPVCDLCHAPALYDALTITGHWAFMCQKCFSLIGVGLGLGKGQKLEMEVTKDA